MGKNCIKNNGNYYLSICIPTYNRGKYLKSLLDNICPQVQAISDEKICVCISDNASQDNTKNIVKKAQSKYNRLFYHRNIINIGAFDNFQMASSLVVAEYIWLLGDDDLILSIGVEKVLQALKENESNNINFLFINSFSTNRELTHINTPSEGGVVKGKIYSTGQYLLNDFLFNSLGHISKMVFRRSYWQNSPYYANRDPWEIYPQLKCVFHAIAEGNSYYLQSPLVINCQRAGNETEIWKGRGVTYWCIELPRLVQFGKKEFGFDSKVLDKQIKKQWRNIILEYIKLNLIPENYECFKNDVELCHKDYWYYYFFMIPIKLCLNYGVSRKIIISLIRLIYPYRKLPDNLNFNNKI